MQEEAKTKLATVEEAAAALDLRRDYQYGRGGTVETAETHLRDYWRIIRRRLWVPITVVVVTVTLTTLYMLRSPSIYEGVTTVQIDQEDRVLNLKDLQINMGGSGDVNYLNTQLRNLQSQRIAYLVAKTLDLEHNPGFFPGGARPAGVKSLLLELAEGTRDEQAEMVRLEPYTDRLLGSVDVRPVRETRLIQIRYRHENPDLARKIADTWAEAFITETLRYRYEGTKESGKFLERSIADYKLKVREAEEKLHNYRRDNQVLEIGDKDNTTIARLAGLNQMLMAAEEDRKKAQVIYETSKLVQDPGELAEVQSDENVINLNKRLTEVRQQYAQLLQEYTAEWPAVKQVEAQIKQLEGELRTAQARILTRIENQYKASVAREQSVRSDFVGQKAEAIRQSEGAITAKLLQQEIDTNQQMLKNLLDSYNQVEISAAALTKGNIRITEHSALPRSPVAPKRLNNILLAFALSFIGGIGLVLFLDYINNKIESVEDIDRYLHLPALGVIPVFEGNKSRRLLGRGAAAGATGKEMVPSSRNGSVILTEVEATSAIAESYRQLRTALLLSSAGHAPRTLLVTSSQPAEGKTTTSVNMAISLAQTGAAVLIVDADLRRPRIHKIFGLKNNVGLCNHLVGETELSSLVQVALPNLYVLPVGPLPPNPAELLGSAKMKQVIETLSQNFDYIIIDSPPVVSFADSLILSALVEGVIIVVKGGVTPREMAQRTKAHLQSVGAKILGVVVNQIKLQPHDYYYYSTYYSRYYYGEGDKGKGRDGDDG
jgi:capsular exopolysaccharide synthesis family protein